MDKKIIIEIPVNKQETAFVDLEKIIYIVSNGRKRHFFLNDGSEIITTAAINELEKSLKPVENLVRCHLQYIVNFFEIEKIYRGYKKLKLRNSEKMIPISKTFNKQLRETVNKFSVPIKKKRNPKP